MALNFLLKRSGTASKRPVAASMALGEVDINYNSSTGGLFYKDSAGSIVKVGPAEVGSTAPNSSPAGSAGNSVGEFWYDTANSVLKIWNGTSWVETVSTSGFLSTGGGTMTGNLYISNSELQVDSTGTFASVGTATFSGTTDLNGATSFFFTPTWLENIGPASQVTYDNTTSGLAATEVQSAVDELASGSWLPSATTAAPGIVQLNDTLSSTSTTEALTANQGRELQDQINALVISGGLILAGTIDASTGLIIAVTTAGTAEGYVVGDPLPSPTPGNENTYVIVEVAGTMTPPGGSSTPCNIGDWWLSESSSWYHLSVGYVPTTASTSASGIVQLATDAEVQAGVNTEHAVTSSGLQSKVSDSTSTTSSTTLASSTAVKAAYDAGIQGQTDAAAAQATANAAVPDSSFTALGDLLVGAGAGTYGNLVTGADGTVLTANSTCPLGVEWVTGGGASGTVTSVTAGTGLTGGTITTSGTISLDTACVVEPADFTALGQILVGTGASTYSALTVGTNGQMLYACSACPAGIRWGAAPTTSPATPVIAGTLKGCVAVTGFSGNVTALGCSAGQGYSGGYAGGTAVGYFAMNALTSGDNNTAIGASSAQNMDGGAGNTLLGASSGSGLGTGSCNVFLGLSTGSSVSTGARNVVIGPQVNVSEGSCQLAIGYDATNNWLTGNSTKAIRPGAGIIDCAGSCGTAGQVLMSNGSNAVCWGTAGGGGGSFATPTACGVVFGVSNLTDSSIALGYGALQANRGTCNAAIGTNSMNCSTLSWSCNVSLGTTALQGTTGGATASNVLRNVAIGTRAMEFLGSGAQNNISDNIGIGACALYNLRGGNTGNIAIGTNSGVLAMTSNNVSIGTNSLCRAGVGDRNVVLGNNAASALCGGGRANVIIGTDAVACAFLTGNFNVIIGDSACAPVASGSNQLVLGPWMTGCSNQSIRPLAGIVDQLGSTGTVGQYLWTSGSNAIRWSASSPSDIRDKEVIGEIATALPVVNGLDVISYYWKDRETNERSSDEVIYGFSAQQMQSVDPILVDGGDEDHLRIYDKKLVPLLVKAIQELSAKNEALEARVAQLES